MAGALQPHLFLHGPEECQGRSRQILLEQRQCRRQHHGRPRAVIGTQRRARIGGTDLPTALHGPTAHADRDRVQVCQQQPPGARLRARQPEDQVPGLSGNPRPAVGRIAANPGGPRTGRQQMPTDAIGDRRLLPTRTRNRQ